MDAPRRVQNQVNESFGFEVSLDAVVLFDVSLLKQTTYPTDDHLPGIGGGSIE